MAFPCPIDNWFGKDFGHLRGPQSMNSEEAKESPSQEKKTQKALFIEAVEAFSSPLRSIAPFVTEHSPLSTNSKLDVMELET